MSGGGLTILDGTQLRGVDMSLPPSKTAITGWELLDLAEKRVSVSLYGIELPEILKSAALHRLGILDVESFRSTVLDHANAKSTVRNYVDFIADELRDDPIVVVVLDGTTLQMFFEDEDDFAMLAENLFMELDTEDKGKISKNKIKNALIHMGIDMGIPPMSEYPQLADILKRNEAEGEEEVGQAQFALLLQHVLQELANNLSKERVVVLQNLKIANGSNLKKLLADDKLLEEVVEKIMQENCGSNDEQSCKIKCFLEKHWKDLGLPPLKDGTDILFDGILTEVNAQICKDAADSEKDGLLVILKDILGNFSEKLDANPVLYDPIN